MSIFFFFLILKIMVKIYDDFMKLYFNCGKGFVIQLFF